MRGGGVARALFEAAITWIGWLPGGLALAGIAATALFAAINGSSVATAMAMGSLLVPMMVEKGYKPGFAMGLTAAAATLGILIPPSLPMILIGLIAEVSIPRLFLAGVVPGLLQAVLFAVYVLLVARRVGGAPMPLATRGDFLRSNLRALPALTIPAVILGGLYGGFVTLTEAAVLGAVVSLVVVVLAYGPRSPRRLGGFFVEAIDRTAVVVVIVIGASLLARLVVESGLKPWQFLLILNVILLVMGMFLEGVAIILIVVPVVAPVIRQIGIEPEHFAVVVVINIELALLSPPIGLNLFVMSNVAGRPVGEVLRGTLPFFFLMLGLLMLVTLVPQISTWLPSVMMPRP
jgi:C4-dicarboxylate transporter DctM subunit